jgi:hypothetical protein
MVNISYIIVPHRKIDLSNPIDSPSGSCFMPDSPTPEPLPVRAWPDKTREAFDKYFQEEPGNRFVLTSKKRADL